MAESYICNPLDDETVWGVPDKPVNENKESDFCLIKQKRCIFWDDGCQRNICYLEDEN